MPSFLTYAKQQIDGYYENTIPFLINNMHFIVGYYTYPVNDWHQIQCKHLPINFLFNMLHIFFVNVVSVIRTDDNVTYKMTDKFNKYIYIDINISNTKAVKLIYTLLHKNTILTKFQLIPFFHISDDNFFLNILCDMFSCNRNMITAHIRYDYDIIAFYKQKLMLLIKYAKLMCVPLELIHIVTTFYGLNISSLL